MKFQEALAQNEQHTRFFVLNKRRVCVCVCNKYTKRWIYD